MVGEGEPTMKLRTLALAALIPFALVACDDDPVAPEQLDDIVDCAREDGYAPGTMQC